MMAEGTGNTGTRPSRMPRAYTVSQVNRYVSHLFSEDFALQGLTIKGEVSNLKYHGSGHVYFTLKDDASQIQAILFAGDRAGLSFRMENGMSVLCTGRLGVYERGGTYQLYAKKISLDGVGSLYAQFERRKQELLEMGYFDPMYKKPIPRYAMRVGIVTARTGAAVRDIVQIARRRNPYVELVLFPALVQGEGAADSIAEGIETLDKLGLDVLIVGRGGGPIEDLWAFNEERVAEAIFHADTPVVSAVGHETDTTIADFVADLRAPTPSAAAELCVFEYRKCMEDLAGYADAFQKILENRLHEKRRDLSLHKMRLAKYSPEARLREGRLRLMNLEEDFRGRMRERLEYARQRKEKFAGMRQVLEHRLTASRHKLEIHAGRLELFSPLRKLSEGYAYVQDLQGRRVASAGQLPEGAEFWTTLRDGRIRSQVREVERFPKELGAEG